MLDKQKSSGDSMSDVAWEEIYGNYKNWIKDYIDPVHDEPFLEDCGMFKPQLPLKMVMQSEIT